MKYYLNIIKENKKKRDKQHVENTLALTQALQGRNPDCRRTRHDHCEGLKQ